MDECLSMLQTETKCQLSLAYSFAITSKLSCGFLSPEFLVPWVLVIGALPRLLESRFTLQITKTVTSRIKKVTAPMIKLSCHFSKSWFSNLSFSTGGLRSVVTVKEKIINCLMSAFCDTGVAVTLTCVTVPGEASC